MSDFRQFVEISRVKHPLRKVLGTGYRAVEEAIDEVTIWWGGMDSKITRKRVREDDKEPCGGANLV